MDEHGIDWEEFVPPADTDVQNVIVPPIQSPFTDEQNTLLCDTFDPLSMSDNRNGVDVYCAVRQFVCDTLSQ